MITHTRLTRPAMNATIQHGESGVSETGHAVGNPACPECQGATYRVHRRYIDLLGSLFNPVRRYRCISLACSWEGNLKKFQPR